MNAFAVLLAQLLVVLCTAQLLGALMQRLGQPRLMGQMLAGLLLGHSALGALWPGLFEALFTPARLGGLTLLGQLGLIFFLFRVGLEFRPPQQGTLLVRAAGVAAGGMLLPFALSLPLSALLLERGGYFGAVSPLAAGLFLALALAVTAFPVLVRILQEYGLTHTRLGQTVLLSASLGDVLAWCLLGGVLALAGASASSPWLAPLGLGVGVLLLGALRPLLQRVWPLLAESGRLTLLLVLLLSSALGAEWVGIHAAFGAFAVGLALPREHEGARLTEPLEGTAAALLLPLYFAGAGLKVQLGTLSDAGAWGLLALIVLLACLGKVLGCGLAARLLGESPQTAAAIGVLMNARGLMELVLLGIGLESGIITPALYTPMVLMTLMTTALTPPLLLWLRRRTRALAEV